MSRDSVSHIHYEIHMRMFLKVVTRDCKQYNEKLIVPESLMGVYGKEGSSASGKISTFDISHE